MKRDSFRIALLLSLAIFGKVSAQADEETFINSQAASENAILLTQKGTSNEAYIQQVSISGSVDVKALQAGEGNHINLVQSGYYNVIRIDQDGAGNRYDADIQGEDVKIDIVQHGFENILFESLLLNNTDFTIIQQGDRNEITHTGILSNSSGIQIRQQGSDMKLIIQTN